MFHAKASVDVWFVHGYYKTDIQTFTKDKQKAILFLSCTLGTRFQQLTRGCTEEFALIVLLVQILDKYDYKTWNPTGNGMSLMSTCNII